MPVILREEDYDCWLDPKAEDPAKLVELLKPYSASEMTAFPICTLVNNPRTESAKCIEPLAVG